jgi:hypothetical protein
MRLKVIRLAQTEAPTTTSGPKWVPQKPKIGIPLVAGVLTVALLATGLAILGAKK